MVRVVVPREQIAADGAGVLERAEPARKLRPVLHGPELRFGERIVVAHAGPRMTGVDAQIREEQRDELAPHRRATVRMNGELVRGDALLQAGRRNQALRQVRIFVARDHPAHRVAAEEVEDDVQRVVAVRDRALEFGDVPRPDLIRARCHELGCGIRRMPGLGAPLAHFRGRREHPIHCARGTEVPLLLEQRGMDFGGRLVDEPLAVQHVEHRLAFGGTQRARRRRTGPRWCGAGRGAPPAIERLGAQLAISVNNCPPPRDPRSRMTSFKRTQRKDVQKASRVRNWREYETGLRARGSLTVWLGLTDGKLANWNSPRPTRRKPGRQRKYSNHAIETTVTLGLMFGLASRQTEGFLRSLLTLLNLDNDVPDHSTISRRKARLGKVASYERRTVKPVHLRIDSSGLSVHVGQWRTPPKARDYRKLHLAVDEHTSDVVACALTSKRARDASRVASLVGQIERPIASAKADAAYDTGDVYQTLENHRAHRSPTVLIPPRKGAQLALDSAGTRQRNRNIRARSRVGKRKGYVASGYSRRSKVETTFHRYKAILGSAMRARGLASQRVEVRLGCKILNTMTALGIPDGEMIG